MTFASLTAGESRWACPELLGTPRGHGERAPAPRVVTSSSWHAQSDSPAVNDAKVNGVSVRARAGGGAWDVHLELASAVQIDAASKDRRRAVVEHGHPDGGILPQRRLRYAVAALKILAPTRRSSGNGATRAAGAARSAKTGQHPRTAAKEHRLADRARSRNADGRKANYQHRTKGYEPSYRLV